MPAIASLIGHLRGLLLRTFWSAASAVNPRELKLVARKIVDSENVLTDRRVYSKDHLSTDSVSYPKRTQREMALYK